MSRILTTVAAAFLALAGGNAARADGQSVLPTIGPVWAGSFYWSVGGYAMHQPLPSFGYGVVRNSNPANPDRDFFRLTPSVTGGGPSLTMGYALDPAQPGGAFGMQPRLEVLLGAFIGTGRHSAAGGPVQDGVPPGTANDVYFPYLGGTTTPPQILPGGIGIAAVPFVGTATIRTHLVNIDAALRYRTDFAVRETVILSPSIGLVGGGQRIHQHLTMLATGVATVPGTGPLQGTVQQTLQTWNLGGEAGLQATWRAWPQIEIGGGVTAAVMYRRTHLDGNDCYAAAGTPCGAALGGVFTSPFTSSISTSRSTVAFRLGLNAAFTYNLGFAKLTLTGFGNWDTAVPSVRPGQAGPGFGFGTVDASPASIRFSSEWSYGGGIAMTFPLN